MEPEEREMITSSSQQAKKTVVELSEERYKHFMKLLYDLICTKYQVSVYVCVCVFFPCSYKTRTTYS